MNLKVVLDTNVLLSGLRSKNGASYRLLEKIPEGHIKLAISVPLMLEYETVLCKNLRQLKLSRQDIDDFLDYFCSIAEHTKIYYLWRPFLKDPYDDHLLEVSVASKSAYIVTYNTKDFVGVEQFGIHAVAPDFILTKLGY